MTNLFHYEAAITRAQSAAAAYYAGTDLLMTDSEYDELLGEISQHEADHPEQVRDHGLFTQVAAGVSAGGDVAHPSPMLSLEKVTDEDGIRKFLERLADAGWATRVSVQPKLDGMAIRAVYDDAHLIQVVTRGDGRTGEDVTERILRDNVTITGLPRQLGTSAPVAFEVRGELLMSRDDFEVSNRNRIAAGKPGFANPRNATAGSVRAETLEYDVQLTFVTYDHTIGTQHAMEETGGLAGFIFADDLPGSGTFITDSTLPGDGESGVLSRVEDFGAQRADYLYPTDGIVIKAASAAVRERLGEGSRAPKWAVAFKYEAQTGETTIRDIIVEVGRTGNLSFTAVFDPVLVDGSTISRASLHNTSLIAEKDIRIGSKAVVYKANDIIPQVLSVTNDESTVPWVAPTEDADGFPYVERGKFLTSTNPADSVGALIRYAASRDVLDIDGLGGEIADALASENIVDNVSDLFTLDVDVLADLDMGFTSTGSVRRLGTVTARKLVDQIDVARSQPLNRVITALGIRLTGRTFGRRLAAHFRSLGALLAASEADLLAVDGIGPERARVILDGIRRNQHVIRALIDMGVTSEIEDDEHAGSATLTGLSVVVTGSTKGTALEAYGRNEMNELIERHGGKSSGSVSKNTGLLVAGDGAGSKLAKATELGVEVISPDEFAARLGLL
ncbi:NAD-dependent DNA ligase LigA [Microbacterium sp. 4NA327F11]|uniref:NAD-dependent DNA ligase LigA n=1 Tax=Microbacterium sp. 4NA327F11 TaxID=2502229 RepID=UPI0010FA5CC8|nr:NAD-dependent DNA ligase LigA [Microbacterium sp. 4NA327F11]